MHLAAPEKIKTNIFIIYAKYNSERIITKIAKKFN